MLPPLPALDSSFDRRMVGVATGDLGHIVLNIDLASLFEGLKIVFFIEYNF